MKYEIDNPGQHGVVKDILEFELPNNAWSDGKNVIFEDGFITRIDGEELHFAPELSATANEKIRYLEPVRGDGDYYWVYCTDTSVWYVDTGGVKTNIQAATGSSTQWTSGFIEGQLLLTSSDFAAPFYPISWIPGGASEILRYDSSASTTWADVPISCRSMRAFRQYGIALDVTESGIRRSRRVQWSHPADPGATPATWDYAKPEFDAGYVDLDDDPEPVIDSAPLRGDNIIYKYNSIHRMTPIGPPFIFGFSRIFNNAGVRSRNCVKEFYGKHVCFGFEDIIIHDGQEHLSILDHKMRRFITNNVDDTNSQLSIVAIDHQASDIYFCFPELGASHLTTAVVWNWSNNTTTIRDMNDNLYMATGLVSPTGLSVTFDNDTDLFGNLSGAFNAQLFSESRRSLALAYSDATRQVAVKTNSSNSFLNSDIVSFVERQGLPIPGAHGFPDTKELKFIYRVYVRASGNATLTIRLAEQHELNGPITWHSYDFHPLTDYKIDCRVTTRIPGIRVGAASSSTWKLYGITIEYELAGMR